MLSLNNVKANKWSRKSFKRLWRWNSSWKWTFSWRGCKWQNSRAWWWVPAWFEWGQTPLFRRMPKLKWFKNSLFKKEFNIVNISDLELLSSKWIKDIDKTVLLENKIIRNKNLPVKLLARWDIKEAVSVKVNKSSNKAKEILEKIGWKLELV